MGLLDFLLGDDSSGSYKGDGFEHPNFDEDGE